MKLYPVQNYEDGKLEWFKCKCGNDKFIIYDEVYEERGIAEFGFDCKCGKPYYFLYGNVGSMSLKRWYEKGILKGFYPTESFVNFEDGEEQ